MSRREQQEHSYHVAETAGTSWADTTAILQPSGVPGVKDEPGVWCGGYPGGCHRQGEGNQREEAQRWKAGGLV